LVRLVGVEFVHLKIKGDLMVVKAVDTGTDTLSKEPTGNEWIPFLR